MMIDVITDVMSPLPQTPPTRFWKNIIILTVIYSNHGPCQHVMESSDQSTTEAHIGRQAGIFSSPSSLLYSPSFAWPWSVLVAISQTRHGFTRGAGLKKSSVRQFVGGFLLKSLPHFPNKRSFSQRGGNEGLRELLLTSNDHSHCSCLSRLLSSPVYP